MNEDMLATLEQLARVYNDTTPFHWTTAEGIKVTLFYDPENPLVPVIKSDHLFHVLKIHYNAMIRAGLIDIDTVEFSVFSRNLNIAYVKANKDKVAFDVVRMIIELSQRTDLSSQYVYFFNKIVENMYNYFVNNTKKALTNDQKEDLVSKAPRLSADFLA